MVEIKIAYEGSLRCTAKHTPSGTTIFTDAPTDNQGKGESFSPTDLVATALGSCMLTIMGIAAQKHQIDLSGATVTIQKEMITQPVRRIGKLGVVFNIPAKLTPEQKQMLENAAKTCPVHRSVHPDIEMPIKFEWA